MTIRDTLRRVREIKSGTPCGEPHIRPWFFNTVKSALFYGQVYPCLFRFSSSRNPNKLCTNIHKTRQITTLHISMIFFMFLSLPIFPTPNPWGWALYAPPPQGGKATWCVVMLSEHWAVIFVEQNAASHLFSGPRGFVIFSLWQSRLREYPVYQRVKIHFPPKIDVHIKQ